MGARPKVQFAAAQLRIRTAQLQMQAQAQVILNIKQGLQRIKEFMKQIKILLENESRK